MQICSFWENFFGGYQTELELGPFRSKVLKSFNLWPIDFALLDFHNDKGTSFASNNIWTVATDHIGLVKPALYTSADIITFRQHLHSVMSNGPIMLDNANAHSHVVILLWALDF